MSGMDEGATSEAAAPKTRDFANNNHDDRNDKKHDTTDHMGANKASTVLRRNREKENLANHNHMLRRMKNMALAPLQFGGGK